VPTTSAAAISQTTPAAPPAVEQDALERAVARRGANLGPAVESGRRLIVAGIMDPFTRRDFAPECTIVDLHPDRWQAELELANADLLFIESAWRGHDESWYDTVQTRPRELVDIVKWCREHGVPTVFWNKEDPVYYDRYIKVAELFDHVFTTDLDSVPRYMRDLGHRRVHVLPFAAQPLASNPIETLERKQAAVFAGSHYPGFKQRNRHLFAQIDGTSRVIPVEIYDRYFNSDKSFFRWPQPYDELIVGTLPPDQIDLAYKGYLVALNVNTVTSSQTMLARRVFDLLASGSPIVSNFSRSIPVLFGDLIPASNSADGIEAAVRTILNDPDTTDKRRAMGVRHILRHHTYARRYRHLIETVSGAKAPTTTPQVGLVAGAGDGDDVRQYVEFARVQSAADVRLVVVSDSAEAASACAAEGIACITTEAAGRVRVAEALGEVNLVAVLSPGHWYGPHYLDGMLDAEAYSTAAAVAKTSRYRAGSQGIEIVDGGHEYRWWDGDRVPWHRAIVRAEHCRDLTVAELVAAPEAVLPAGLDVLGIDRFDYCEGARAPLDAMAELSADLPIQTGATFEAIVAAEPTEPGMDLSGAAFPTKRTGPNEGEGVTVHATKDGVVVGWSYNGERYVYLPFQQDFPISEVAENGFMYLRFAAQGSGSLGINVSWLDADEQRVPGMTYYGDSVRRIRVPETAERALLFLTVRGKGTKLVRSITVSPRDFRPSVVLEGWASRTLLVTDNYPAYEDLYRNAFVHTRVRGYRERGRNVDVYVLRGSEAIQHREFHGVRVMTGDADGLRQLLDAGHYTHVLVHFLNAPMWAVIRDHVGRIPVTVWIHGSDIQPWWRREFNYRSEEERAAAQKASDERMALWREISASSSNGIRFVFVSHAFRDEIADDLATLGFGLDDRAVSVLHNPVDTDLFSYVPKDPEQRKRILLIRPFAFRKYANDLAAAAIRQLSTEPWFEELTFRIIGDGQLFDEDTAPLVGYPNVTIERRFLTQRQIAELHREYGVFLVPTRHDTQGVSRDEAMASGLVPVTSDLPVVREFLSEKEGYISAYEDAAGLADAIRDLYHNPDVFLARSKAAAARIRRTVASAIVIPQELELFVPQPVLGDKGGSR
jgi:glycosyltransferase involved in cell wall biosynthesis/spore maturation protein CgeB